MSSRALRRLQKQQQEEKALQEAQAAEAEVSEDEDVAPAKSKQSAFAMLDEAERESDDEDDGGEPVDVVQKSVDSTKIAKSTPPESSTPKSAGKKKKKKKKGKGVASGSHTPALDDDDEDDIDAVLASLAKAKVTDQDSKQDHKQEDYDALLSVESQHLHAINEMRRLFGRDVIDDRPQQPARQAQRGGGRVQQDQGRGFPAVSLNRNIFVQGKDTWVRATTGGLGMEVVSKDEKTGVVEYRFVHSTAYQETQKQYEIAVASMDPNRLVVLLQQNPYHIATLLQVSELMKHERQHTEAGDVLERALFAFGRTVHSTFGAKMGEGKARLDFRRPENREFYLAGWRYIQDLSMRSTWRTVYEWANLIFSLDPIGDPYALKLVLAQYAIRAHQAENWLKLDSSPVFGNWNHEASPDWFALTSCQFQCGNKEEAEAAMIGAYRERPHTVHVLCKALDISPIPSAIWPYHEAPTAREALLTAMYVTRAKDLWNTEELKGLVKRCNSLVNKEEIALVQRVSKNRNNDVSIPEARHVFLTENAEYLRLLADCNVLVDTGSGASTSVMGSKATDEAGPRPTQDPFPPIDTIRSYDPTPAGGLAGSSAGNGLGHGLLAQLPAQIRAILGQMQPQEREAFLANVMRMHEEDADGAGTAPGGWTEEDDEAFDRAA